MAKLVRYFGQTPDYWLDNCTLRDWTDIWSRELMESPPVDDLAAAYMGYKSPESGGGDAGAEDEIEVWDCPYPEMTE